MVVEEEAEVPADSLCASVALSAGGPPSDPSSYGFVLFSGLSPAGASLPAFSTAAS